MAGWEGARFARGHVRPVPGSPRTPEQAGGDALGRRATDALARAGAHGPSAGTPARRALLGPGAADDGADHGARAEALRRAGARGAAGRAERAQRALDSR